MGKAASALRAKVRDKDLPGLPARSDIRVSQGGFSVEPLMSSESPKLSFDLF